MSGWGKGYFRINTDGHVAVHPTGKADTGLDLYRLAMDLNAQGMQLPLLIRFSDLLQTRIELLANEFQRAMDEFQYDGAYTTVYPIKVNQQRHVIEEIVSFGSPFGVGLECGSKAELQAVLGLTTETNHLIVCNGYKDEEFLRFALIAQRLGHRVFIVIEQLGELDLALEVADELGVTPTLGVRIKLATQGRGRWAKSAGEHSKFGLSAPHLMRLLERLTAMGKADVLKLLHFHLGSQITDIRYIKDALEEIARFYIETRKLGFDLSHVDVGGGLGVDYEGSRTTRPASMNYTVAEYANDVVYVLGTMCKEQGVPMPDLISESGRSLAAHHALLLVNVTDVDAQTEPLVPSRRPDAHRALVELHENLEGMTVDRVDEVFHDAVLTKDRVRELFANDAISLQELAEIEELYLCTMNTIARLIAPARTSYPEITAHLERVLVDRYFCNFSVFQSLPDNWAIDQLFPIMPIHRLDERPTRRGTLQDMTCDSDGVIDRFAGGRRGKPSLELHPVRAGEAYVLGIFLTGAYQEILGDLHNLFGDTNAVHVKLLGSGYEVTELVHGDTVTEVLNYVQFRAGDLVANFRRKVSAAVGLDRADANAFIADYLAGLEGYTYLEGVVPPEASGGREPAVDPPTAVAQPR